MEYFDYTDLDNFVYDYELKQLLCLNNKFDDIYSYLLQDDFLTIDNKMKIPFFAVTRDYIGAREKNNFESTWIVKQVKEKDILQTEMATISFFLDFFTHTLSAPIIITKINGSIYKATKLILRAEQLSGANYTERKQLKEQLLLDIINRWIYFDEDRNPNNYMIKYNSKNDQIIIAIDFLNVDLLTTEINIQGLSQNFGWKRKEKTRYLTPLQSENCLEYDMAFFNMRFSFFNDLSSVFLEETCRGILRFNKDRNELSSLISKNLLSRIKYIYKYFNLHIKERIEDKQVDKYRDMGKTFSKLYSSSE